MATIVDPGRARPLRWWSAAQLDAAAERLRAVLTPWAHDWGLQLDDLVARNTVDDAAVLPHGADALPLAEGAAWLQTDQGASIERLHAVLFGVPPAAVRVEPTLADETAAEAWNTLAEALSAALPVQSAPASMAATARWSGGLRLDAVVLGAGQTLRLALQLHPAAAEAWCAGASAPARAMTSEPRQALQAVNDVLAERRVRVAIHLTPVVLDLGSLQSLQIGDVLTLPHGLDQALDVAAALDASSPVAQPLCKGHLGQREGRLAVELAGTPTAH